MAVKDVFRPDATNPTDPRKPNEEGGDYWEKRKKEVRARREVLEEEKAMETINNPPAQPEAPFQIKGSVDLGHIDVQQHERELKETIATIQNDAQDQIKALNEKNEHYREEVQKVQLAMVENTLRAQIESMQKMIQDGLAKPKDPGITERLSEITQIAGVLGYRRPDADAALPAEIKLQMLKMEMEEKHSQRTFEWDKMMSERNWQLQIKQLEQTAASQNAQIQIEREKRGMWASPFESIGTAIARGLIDSGGAVPKVASQPKRKRSGHRLQAGEEDSGVVNCPECGEPIAIAPKARSAVCPSCEETIAIDRIPGAQG